MENQIPIGSFSECGKEKLEEMAKNPDVYSQFLKFQGRIFKHNTDIALEFFTQNPKARFVATEQQWKQIGYTIKQGENAIQFADKNGKDMSLYDFSQTEQSVPPRIWEINQKNADKIKEELGISKEKQLSKELILKNVKINDIKKVAIDLGVSAKNYPDFQKSYLNAVHLIISGRLEIGNNKFNVPTNLSALQMLNSPMAKLNFINSATKTARDILMQIENAIKIVNEKAKIERELQGTEQFTQKANTETLTKETEEPVSSAENKKTSVENTDVDTESIDLSNRQSIETKEPVSSAENKKTSVENTDVDTESIDLSNRQSIETKELVPSAENKKTSVENTDVEISDNDRLVSLSEEINKKELQIIDLLKTKDYGKMRTLIDEVENLNSQLSELEKAVQEKEITEEDIATLRAIQPPRKSVQNFLDSEVAKTTKFEKLLKTEMNEKSAYEMRKNNNEWRNDKSKTVPIIEISDHEVTENISELRKKENINKFFRGNIINDDTNITISIVRESIKESIAKAIQDDKRGIPLKARINALFQTDEIVKNAICFDSQISEEKNKSPNSLFIHRLYSPIEHNGELYLVNLAIDEMYRTEKEQPSILSGTSNRLYNLRDIKIVPMKPGFDPRFPLPYGKDDVSISTKVSISQLYELVKAYDKNFFENPEAVGRKERELELYQQAQLTDIKSAINSESEFEAVESVKQAEKIAESRELPVEEVVEQLEKKIHEKTEEMQLDLFSYTEEQSEKISDLFSSEETVHILEDNSDVEENSSNNKKTTNVIENNSDDIHNFAETFGLDEELLKSMMELSLTEANINEFGKFDKLYNTRDKEKVQAYFSDVPMFKTNAKMYNKLHNALLNKDFSLEAKTAEKVDTNINFSDENNSNIDDISEEITDDIPEIKYAGSYDEKIRDNISAIREVKRLERAEQNGDELYFKYYTKEDSDRTLRKYSGWGGLAEVFNENNSKYLSYRMALKDTLTSEEYANAKASTQNAHYTPQIVIDTMYEAIKQMDLPRNSRILEPSCGTGNFITRLPSSLGNTEIVGVELDSITAKIAKYLNNDKENVTIIEGAFEKAPLENNSFDLVIGNIPFGEYKMNDPDYNEDFLIHDAFFRKALDKVAVGGVVAFITSSGTLDKSNPKVREYLAERAELIGAIRLPNNAFSDAGTKVTADIIFLKKRENPLQSMDKKPDWCYLATNSDGLKINSYFVKNPQMILGKMERTSFFNRLTCKPFNTNLKTLLREAVKNIKAKITVLKKEIMMKKHQGIIEPWGKNFAFQVKDDKVYYRKNADMKEVKCSPQKMDKLKILCEIRDVTRELIDKQRTATDEELVPLREKLNNLYDGYIKKYEQLTNNQTKKLFRDDSDFPIIQSLEKYDEQQQIYEKAKIFSERTVNQNIEITSADDLDTALQISLDQKGDVDIVYIAELLKQNPNIVLKDLLDKGAVFIDPEKVVVDKDFSGVVERSEYLSGNVREKLAIVSELVETNSEYKNNVKELTAVIPEDIKSEEISVRMGCNWIDGEDYTEFLKELSGRAGYNSRKCDVSYSTVTGEFEVLQAGSKTNLNVNENTTYGTKELSMYQLAEKLLNQRRIVVKKECPHPDDPSKTITRIDDVATRNAIEKSKLIQKKFEEWIFADSERKQKYEKRYNNIFNSIVGREYDGSHLTFSGMDKNFKLRPHQKNCVARAIYGGNTLAAHVVGAGKSAVIVSTVMKKKELGLINKACVVVPKPLVEQTADEWRKIYPDAKILTVTAEDLSTEMNRNIFNSRVATGNYDAVIVSQEQFEKMPMSKEYQQEFLQQELDKLEDVLRGAKDSNIGKKDYSVKSIEKEKKKLQYKLEKLTNPKSSSVAKDNLIEFEKLGFDYLVCDEAHAYKNGFVATKMTNVAGVTTRASGRAEDMRMKTDYFNEKLGQGHILFATGTPVSNSMTELYVMTRYLRPDILQATGTANFDDWASTFGSVVNKHQQGADGKLKLKTSFAKFANLPELMAMYKEFADIQSADKLDLPRPKLKGGKPQIISVPASPEQVVYVKELARRSEAIANGNVKPTEDNMLKITSEARFLGLGNQAIKSLYMKNKGEIPTDFVETKDGKVDECIEKVAEIYNQTNDTKGVQIIFSDIAVNSDGTDTQFSVYDYIKKELVKTYGIPEEEIIFAPKSDSKNRQEIFNDINNSKYRVVIASTGTLGTGANIQQNLYALHHVDIPWKPSDFEQREGRILRQGNKNTEVEIFNYVTEGTLDSYLYQTVTDKARFIAQLLDDKAPARVAEDCDEKVLTFGEIQAVAEGNTDFKKRIELSNEIAELNMLKKEYARETSNMKNRVEKLPQEIVEKEQMIQNIQADISEASKINDIELTLQNGYKISDKKQINQHLFGMVEKKMQNIKSVVEPVKVNNFIVTVNAIKDNIMFTVKGKQAYSFNAGTSENQNNGKRLSNVFESVIPERLSGAIEKLNQLKEELKQATERINTPFSREQELTTKIEDLNKVEESLLSLSVEQDVVSDETEDIDIETTEETKERKENYEKTDDDDFKPLTNENNRPTPRRK